MNLKHFSYLVLLSLFLFLCSSCDRKSHSSKQVFHYNQPNAVTSLDPAFAKSQNNIWVVDHLFNQLVDLDDQLSIIPELAHRWEVSSDGLKYTFHLRTDVYFHVDSCFYPRSTRKLVASDVEYSLMRLQDPELSAPGSWILLNRLQDSLPIVCPDDSTIIFNLKNPFAPFLSLLTMQYCSVLPQEAVRYYGLKIREHPVGTGPFVLKKWLDRQGIFLKRNTHYFKQSYPQLEGVRISFIEDRNTACLELLRGSIDFFSGIQSSFAPLVLTNDGGLRAELKDQLNFVKSDYLNTEYIGINLDAIPNHHALHDVRVRQALNFAINRKEMIRIFRYGLGTEAQAGFVPEVLLNHGNVLWGQKFEYDPERARQLLKESSYLNKSDEDQKIILYTNKDYLDLIAYIARQWQEVGVHVDIELMETATLREKMRNGSLPVFRASWIADYPDPESFMCVFYGKNPAPPNYTRFHHAEFDSLYLLTNLMYEKEKRDSIFLKMEKILFDKSPVIFLFYDQISLLSRKSIRGLKGNSINLLKLEEVHKD